MMLEELSLKVKKWKDKLNETAKEMLECCAE